MLEQNLKREMDALERERYELKQSHQVEGWGLRVFHRMGSRKHARIWGLEVWSVALLIVSVPILRSTSPLCPVVPRLLTAFGCVWREGVVQHEIQLVEERMKREVTALNQQHQEDMLRERRLFEAAKIQLAHQVTCDVQPRGCICANLSSSVVPRVKRTMQLSRRPGHDGAISHAHCSRRHQPCSLLRVKDMPRLKKDSVQRDALHRKLGESLDAEQVCVLPHKQAQEHQFPPCSHQRVLALADQPPPFSMAPLLELLLFSLKTPGL